MDEVADCFVVIEDSVLEGYRKVQKAVLDPTLGKEKMIFKSR
jgi:hypothetical protein